MSYLHPSIFSPSSPPSWHPARAAILDCNARERAPQRLVAKLAASVITLILGKPMIDGGVTIDQKRETQKLAVDVG